MIVKKVLNFSILIATILIVSCNPSIQNSQKNRATSALKKVSSHKHPYQASKTRTFDLIHTKLEVNFDWQKQYLNGKATLLLKPYFYQQSILNLDAKGMDILSIQILHKEKYTPTYQYNKKSIAITLKEPCQLGDSINVEITYIAKPNELPKGGSEAITEDKGLYFINADGKDYSKPKQVWTQGETEASSCWFPTIDATNERCTQEMYITADTSMTILSNGEMIYSKNNSNGTRTEYWKMDKPHAPYLFMMAVGKFAVVTDTMKPSLLFNWKNFEVKYYVDPEYKAYAKDIFGNTPEMIEFFSTKLGIQYPWNKYAQVVVHDFVSGAMENTTASVFMEALHSDNRALLDKNWDFIIAHELFHHWFGDLVTCESWANLPLNESFANYSEFLWAEYKLGLNEAFHHAESEAKEYFDEAKTKKAPLIRYYHKNAEEMFDRHSYNKGGLVLHMLRKQVGDQAFFKSLNLYLEKNKFKASEIHDLRLAFEEVTGEDLNWFFNQWFLSAGHPELAVSHNYSGGKLKLTVNQLQDSLLYPIFKLPLQIAIWENNNLQLHDIEINKASQTFELSSNSKPQTVIFDYKNQLLAQINHKKTIEEWVFQYLHSTSYPSKKAALIKLFDNPPTEIKGKIISIFENPLLNSTLAKALEDDFWAIRAYALQQFTIHQIPNIEAMISKIVKIAQSDAKPQNQATAMQLLSSLGGNSFDELFKSKLNALPYSVCGAAMDILLRKNDTDALAKVNSLENSENLNIAITLGMHFVKKAEQNKFSWFRKQLSTGDAQKQYNMLFVFENYIPVITEIEKKEAKILMNNIIEKSPHEVIKNQAKKCLGKI
ncbi:MAG: M1 family peptidase [Cytophagales bacterium]|nr:MAG: M1 family peptidase [Cytophagales bacterium]